MKFQPVPLNYPFDALEPYIDKETMETHYTKHYQTYINNLNGVLEKYPDLNGSLDELLGNIDKLGMSDQDRTVFRNNAGGYLNHNIYWETMDPEKARDESLSGEIAKEFGSREAFTDQLSQAALKHFGSGWGWLVRNAQGKLTVYSLPNQDSPHIFRHTPLIGLDVWEHAYYLKYRSARAEYIKNWWNTVKVI